MARVIIQAGGQGKRLHPYTTVLPKPLMPVDDFPIIEIVISQLVSQGLRDITITLGHLGELIRAVVGDGARWGASITYVKEVCPLGTIGPLTLIDGLDEPFLVMNGDVLTDFDFAGFLDDHVTSGAELSVGTYLKLVSISLGVLETDPVGRIVAFREKPVLSYPCSMGIYAFSPALLAAIPKATFFGFDDLMHHCLAHEVDVRAHEHHGLWLDIGRHEDYEKATQLLNEHREVLLPQPVAGTGVHP